MCFLSMYLDRRHFIFQRMEVQTGTTPMLAPYPAFRLLLSSVIVFSLVQLWRLQIHKRRGGTNWTVAGLPDAALLLLLQSAGLICLRTQIAYISFHKQRNNLDICRFRFTKQWNLSTVCQWQLPDGKSGKCWVPFY